MFRTTLAAAAITALASLAAPAAANPLAQLLNYTGQIRAQSHLVQAQTEAAFQACPSSRLLTDDIYDELEDLCRDLDRLEEQIARPLQTRSQLRRLERLAHRLEEQACEVDESIQRALEWARRRGQLGRAAQLPGYGFAAQSRIVHHTVGHRGMRLMVRSGRFNLSIGGPQPHVVARPIGFPGAVEAIGSPEPLAAALCAESDRLRLMTRQLAAIVCH